MSYTQSVLAGLIALGFNENMHDYNQRLLFRMNGFLSHSKWAGRQSKTKSGVEYQLVRSFFCSQVCKRIRKQVTLAHKNQR